MKYINNKVTALPKEKDEMSLYSDLIIFCINHVGKQDGLSVDEMEKRLRIKAVCSGIEKDQYIEIEDADFTVLQGLIVSMQWGIMHEDIVTFKKDIFAAVSEKPTCPASGQAKK